MIANETNLGWVLFGENNEIQTQYTEKNMAEKHELFTVIENNEQKMSLHKLMRDYFSTEEFGVKPGSDKLISKSEERANTLMKSTMKKVNLGYEIGLLWKDDKVVLPES